MTRIDNAIPRVCAVVLNWNRADDTLKCLTSLLPWIMLRKLALVVCDNASHDDSIDRIRHWAQRYFRLETGPQRVESSDNFWDFLLVQTDANRGYAGGNNVGIRYALAQYQFDYIWILNNDTVVAEHALDELLQCARRDPGAGVFGSTLVDSHERDLVQTAGGCRYHPLTTIMSTLHGGQSLDHVLTLDSDIQLDYVSGAAMFCRARMLEDVGLFDERFFLYYEEMDLARRMRAVGYSQRWCKKSVVYHKGGASTGSRSIVNRQESWLSNYHENLSTLLYTRKHHSNIFPIAASLRFVGKSLAYLFHGRIRLFSALASAYRDALTGKRTVTSKTQRGATVLEMGFSEQSDLASGELTLIRGCNMKSPGSN